MSAILYGNLSVEILDDAGARISRLTRPSPALSPRPVTVTTTGLVTPLGRQADIDDAYAAVRAHRPIEFNAACGYGKSTLLRWVAAHAVTDRVSDASVYLLAGPDALADLLQRLVAEFYTSDVPVKPTRDQCAQLLGQVQALVVLDDVGLKPDQTEQLLRVLPGCDLLLSSRGAVLGRHGRTHALAGLPDAAATELVTRDLGRQLTRAEQAAVSSLIAAVDGQPLHLRQAAALVRENQRSFQELASTAEHGPEQIDRLSVNALAVPERRALAVLALAAGALLPAGLVGAMGDVALIGQALGSLHRRGLAEQDADRFGLPVCKVAILRDMLLKDLSLASAVRELVDWLSTRDPTSADSLAAAGAAMAIIEWAAELGEWPAVVRLARVAEPVLTLAGRWEASRHALERGLQAAMTTGDQAAEALFRHEQGTLALCEDDLTVAGRLLRQALDLRLRQGDHRGAAVTRHNLQILQPEQPHPAPAPAPPRSRRRVAAMAACAAVLLLLGIGLARAATSAAGRHRLPETASSSPASVNRAGASPSATPRPDNTSPASSPDGGTPSPPVVLTLGPAELPSVVAGARANVQITATGGTAPYTFSVTAGALPAGLSLESASGRIIGIPAAAGSYQFTITATGSSPADGAGSQAYTLQVTPAVTLVLAPTSLPGIEVSDCPSTLGYAQPISAAGGTAPYTYAVTAGSPPPGLSLNQTTGVISGKPSALGTFTFTVTATDSAPSPDTGSQSYTIAVTQVAVSAC
jgi:hypothetical protein